ncbi:c-type cytochrome [Candidatus Thiodiazotropha sp. CDECU1]|uniref:c-type cytochrome n=1 Tax=Candidatus Thiodiazotropha sp. CDECU1 TaxID=3065865 RepID=UPI0029305CDA|nr:c-type cytochrome [Candidatus Thiodiazotropha sp. CDECU1]
MNKMKIMLLAASTTVVSLGAVATASADPVALATQRGCMACHQVETKVVGPAYKEVAAKYKGQEGAVEMLSAKVKAGGSGVWGPVPMPPNAHVSDEDIKVIVEWVMTL